MRNGVELFYSPSLKDLKTVFNKYFCCVQICAINQIFIASIAYYASYLYNSLLPFVIYAIQIPRNEQQDLFAKLIC